MIGEHFEIAHVSLRSILDLNTCEAVSFESTGFYPLKYPTCGGQGFDMYTSAP